MTNAATNPYKNLAMDYLNKGFSVIPLAYGAKKPNLSGWSKYCDQIMSIEDAQLFFTSARNIGLTLGPASGLCAVDIDTDNPTMLKKIEHILPESPVKKRGAKGYTAFYKFNGLPSKSVKNENGDGIDFLSTGRQTVLPPSLHPSGTEYKWLTNETLLTCPTENIPEISDNTLKQLFDLLTAETQNTSAPFNIVKPVANVDEIKKALDYIPADIEYNDWSKIGMALHDHFNGAQCGLELFDSWSQRGSKYKEREPVKKWASYTVGNGITINTLFALAKQYGGYMTDMEFIQVKKEREENNAKQIQHIKRIEALKKDVITAPPGLVGQITKYIQEVSVKQQPILALAGGIVVAGTVYAQRAQTPSELRSNIYCFGIAETGTGKNDPKRAIQKLFEQKELRSDLRNALHGAPVSRAGLTDAIYATNGKYLTVIDEIGHYLDGINGKTAQSYSKEIMSTFTQLYSNADMTYLGREYSQHGKDAKPRLDMEQPCVCVLGLSVPSAVYDAITKSDILDGFMTRWFILETTDIDPKDNEERVHIGKSSVFKLINDINTITNMLDKNRTNSEPYVVTTTIKANELLKNYKKEFNDARIANIKNGADMACLYTRAYENLEKLSMVAAEITSPTNLPVITEKSVNWAYAVVSLSIERMKVLLEEINKTGYEKKLDDMEEKLKSLDGPISMSTFGSKFRKIPHKERNGLLADLVASNCVKTYTQNNITYVEHMDRALKL